MTSVSSRVSVTFVRIVTSLTNSTRRIAPNVIFNEILMLQKVKSSSIIIIPKNWLTLVD